MVFYNLNCRMANLSSLLMWNFKSKSIVLQKKLHEKFKEKTGFKLILPV